METETHVVELMKGFSHFHFCCSALLSLTTLFMARATKKNTYSPRSAFEYLDFFYTPALTMLLCTGRYLWRGNK